MAISSQQFDTPVPYNKNTRTTIGRATTWSRQPSAGISKQSQGSFISFDDDAPIPNPTSDKGANYLKG